MKHKLLVYKLLNKGQPTMKILFKKPIFGENEEVVH